MFPILIAACLANVVSIVYTASYSCMPLELAILNRRLDVAKMMVIKGANPIAVPGPDGVSGVIPLIEEYYEFGTNEYIKWLFHEHLHPDVVDDHIQYLLKLDIFNPNAIAMFDQAGRHRAHALLTSGHEKVAKALIEHPDHGGIKLLNEKDAANFTAMQIAANIGDLEAVKVIMKL